jgi:hypothetical protein
MQVYIPLLQHQWTLKTESKQPQGRPFQILGLDLLIDSYLKAWLLEINDHPSLNIYFDTNFMGGPKMTDSDIEQVDLYVKKRVVCDAIKVAKKRQQQEQFNSLSQIYPSDCESQQVN